MKVSTARSPLRLGFAGGGTDVSPYADLFGGCVVNATIDKYSYARIKQVDKNTINYFSIDQNVKLSIPYNEFIALTPRVQPSLMLHDQTFRYFRQKYLSNSESSIEIQTYSEAPKGSGLGGSSSIVVAILKSLSEFYDIGLKVHDLAHDAVIIEREYCGFAGGRQDHYSSAYGGMNFMTFGKDYATSVESIRPSNPFLLEIESSIILVDTGISRFSSDIISDQAIGIKDKNKAVEQSLHGIKNEAMNMKDAILKESSSDFMDTIERGRIFKNLSSKYVETDQIQKFYSSALAHGAITGKISGAGGGGFLILLVELKDRGNLIESLQAMGGKVSNCHFTFEGVESW